MFTFLSCMRAELPLCDPMGCSLPGSSVHGILQERKLEWVATPFSRGSSQPSDQTCVSRVAGGSFTRGAPGKPCSVRCARALHCVCMQ